MRSFKQEEEPASYTGTELLPLSSAVLGYLSEAQTDPVVMCRVLSGPHGPLADKDAPSPRTQA